MSRIVMLVFPSREALLEASAVVRENTQLKIHHTAVIAKAEDGETTIFEDDISPNEGRIAGGTLGSLMGALGVANLGAFFLPGIGPIIAIGAGALLGGLIGTATAGFAAEVVDLGIENATLDRLARALEKGHVALVLEAEMTDQALDALMASLAPQQAELVRL